MDVNELKSIFQENRKYTTDNLNELLDYTKKAYIYNEISINDYRDLIYLLETQGAEVPQIDSLKP